MNFPVSIFVKPNKTKTEIIEESDGVIIVNVKAKPIEDKANKEIIRFFSKLTNKKIKIISGKKSRKKILDVG